MEGSVGSFPETFLQCMNREFHENSMEWEFHSHAGSSKLYASPSETLWTNKCFRVPFAASHCNSKTICQAISPPARFSIQVHGRGGRRPWRQSVTCFPSPPTSEWKSALGEIVCHTLPYFVWEFLATIALTKAMFTLYQIAFAPTQKLYRIGLLLF